MRFYMEAYHGLGHGYVAHLHDPLAAAVALDPQLIATQPATVDVELTGTLTRGMTVTDWAGAGAENPTRTSALASTRRCSSTGSSNGSGRSRVGWAEYSGCGSATATAADAAAEAATTAASAEAASARSAGSTSSRRPARPTRSARPTSPGITRRFLPDTTAFGGSTAAARARSPATPAREHCAPLTGNRFRIPPPLVDRPRSRPPAQPVLPAANAQSRGVGGEHPPAGYPYRISLGVKQFHRIVEQHRRRRLGQLAGPWPIRVGPRFRLVAQRGQRDAFGRPATAGQHRHLHRLRTEQTLHPHQRPTGPKPVLLTEPAP